MNTKKTEMLDRVLNIIVKYSDNKVNDIKDFNYKLSDFDISSIKFIKIIIDIETEFNIEFDIDDIDMDKFSTVGDLIDYIQGIMDASI